MADKTIMLVCAAGMSTSLMVNRMKQAAAQKGQAVNIFAVASAEVANNLATHRPDLVLLGPQVRFMRPVIQDKTVAPVRVINVDDFGAMNGAKVLHDAWRVLTEAG